MSLFKKISLLAAAALMAVGLAACSGGSGAAATVNGESIPEDNVTAYIQSVRSQLGVTDDADWAAYLASSGMTAEDIRTSVIEMLEQEIVVKQAAKEAGITVDQAEVDSFLASIKSRYQTDQEYQEFLSSTGYTEDYLKESYENYLYQTQAEEKLVTVTPTDEQIQAAIDERVSTYNGAKRSSHILFAEEDEALANEVLAQLKNGGDFAALAEQYSQDSSGTNGGDVGWDCDATFVQEYQGALDGLSAGEMTQAPVKSQFGWHIILCTEEFSYPEGTKVTKDMVPESIYQDLYDELVSSLKSEAYGAWVDGLMEKAEVTINPMPSGLPYDVKVSAAGDAAAADAGQEPVAGETGADSAAGAAEGQ